MSRDELLLDLLQRWETLRQQGQETSPEELCAGHLGLLDEVRRSIRKLQRVEPLLDLNTGERPGPPAVPGYENLAWLGEGGMGVVYKAQQLRPRRTVALKMINAGKYAGANRLARFHREADTLARYQHSNIVQIYEVGEHDGQPYLALEYVDGGSLADKLAGSPQPPREAAQLLQTLAQAVHHAHQQGVIHRDLKPANVLLSADGTPKITDFGLAKQVETDTGQTLSGAILGTPSYMPPEQAAGKGKEVGLTADVYSLGAILYECLTGRPPFRGETSLETLRQVQTMEPVPVRRLRPMVPRDLETICLTCLAKEPARRYAKALALADDLGRFLNAKPVWARPVGRLERGWRWCRRNPLVAGLAASVALAMLAVVVVSVVAAVLSEQGRRAVNVQWLRAEAAAEAEKEANEQTKRRLAQIEKGVDLLAGLLTGLDPRSQKKGGPPLYEQLRARASQAAAELDAESVGDLLAVARLQTILGNTLLELGDYASAVAVLEKARVTRERDLGTDDPDTLATLNKLAQAYHAAGRLPQAIELFEQVRDAAVQQLGADHADTLGTLNNLAQAYLAAGRRPQAIELLKQVRDAAVQQLGADHPNTLTALNNLAEAYRAAGRLPQAIELFEQVRDALVKQRGTDHPDTLATLNNLATVYRAAGRLPQAIELLKQVRDAAVQQLGADHPNTLLTLANLATAYAAAGKLPEALLLHEQAASGIEKHRFLHQHAGGIIHDTSSAYEEARHWEKAEAWRRKWLAAVQANSGASTLPYANALTHLGRNLLAQKKWTEAEAVLREGLAIREEKEADAWQTFDTRSQLGEALLGEKQYTEAEPLLLKGYEGLKQREAKLSPQTRGWLLRETLERLVQLYDAWGKPDEAEKWRKVQAQLAQPAPKADKP